MSIASTGSSPPSSSPVSTNGTCCSNTAPIRLGFFRRPAIGLGGSAAHQHCPLGGAQPVGPEEGLDGVFVVDDGERARPVGAPQAALETPGIEHAGQRVPDVGERKWL